MAGEATEIAMKETLLRYMIPSVHWTLNGQLLTMEILVESCTQLRERTKSVEVEVCNLVTERQGTHAKLANRHITSFTRKDGSTVSHECFQIMDIDENGLITKAVEMGRNFNDSKEA